MARIYDIPTKYVNITETQFNKLLKQIEEKQYTAGELEISTDFLYHLLHEENNKYIKKLAEALKSNLHIRKLKLVNQNIINEGAIALSEVESLTELDLTHNSILTAGVISLLNANLICLSVQENDISRGLKPGYINQMREAFVENQTITNLSLRRTYVDDVTVARIIEGNKSIKILDLGRNTSYFEGLRPITDNNTLQYLDLSECELRDVAAEIISQNSSLLTLIVNVSNITNKGGAFLSTHPTLRTLYIKDSEMTALGLVCFLHSNLRKVVPDNEQKTKISEFEICEFERAFRYIREEKEHLLTNSIYEQAVDLGGHSEDVETT